MVEDDEGLRYFYRTALSVAGFHVEEAEQRAGASEYRWPSTGSRGARSPAAGGEGRCRSAGTRCKGTDAPDPDRGRLCLVGKILAGSTSTVCSENLSPQSSS